MLPTVAAEIKSGGGAADIASCIIPTYIPSLPIDPKTGSYADNVTYSSGYTVIETAGRVTIAAPQANLETAASSTVSVTR